MPTLKKQQTEVFTLLWLILCSCNRLCVAQVGSVTCDQSPCKNGGTCQSFRAQVDSVSIDSFICTCPSGTLQPLCDSFVLCSSTPCMNGGTCSGSISPEGNQCSCLSPFVLPFCSTDCKDIDCENGGTCTHHGICVCGSSYEGALCEDTGPALPPVFTTCPTTLLFTLTAQTGATASRTWPVVGAADPNGGPVTITSTPDNVDSFPVGSTTVMITATNEEGTSSICSFFVLVTADDIPPMTNCPTEVREVLPMGSTTVVVTWNVEFSDNSGTVTVMQQGPRSGDSFGVGTSEVTFIASDEAGNVAQCTFNVIVSADLGMNPTPTVCPSTFTAFTNNPSPQMVLLPQTEAVDTNGITLIGVLTDPAVNSFTPSNPAQPETVTFTFTDGAGQTAFCLIEFSFILDQTSPTFANCPQGNTLSGTLPQGASSVNIPAVQMISAVDDSNIAPTVVTTPADVTSFSFGTTPVTFTATDMAGNTATCTFTVDINAAPCTPNPCQFPLTQVCTPVIPGNTFACADDVDPPTVFNCPVRPITATPLPGQDTAVINNFPEVTATDNLDTDLISASNVPNGNVFPTGTTPVTITFTDNAGNAATCMFVVQVADVLAPVIMDCPLPPNPAVMVSLPAGQDMVTVTELTVTDNLDVNPTIIRVPSSNSFPAGITPVSFTATDASGNIATCAYNVEVSSPCDSVLCSPPSTCRNGLNGATCAVSCAFAACSTLTNFCIEITPGVGTCTGTTDECLNNCNVPTPTLSCQAGRCIASPLVRTDCPQGCLVGQTCSFGVCVLDPDPPTPNCPADIMEDLPANQQTITIALPVSASDNLDPNPTILISPVGNQFPAGTTPVSVTVIDDAGNTATCSFSVVVTVDIGAAVNPCDPNPCQDGGTCNLIGNTFSCLCDVGFSGDTCDMVQPNPCFPNPCQGATEVCSVSNGVAVCTDVCDPTPCQGATEVCSLNNGVAQCTDICDPTPCQGATEVCSVNNGVAQCTDTSAPVYLISLVIIPVLLIAVIISFIIVRKNSPKDKKATKADDGEDTDYVNAAMTDDPEDYIPLEEQARTVSSSKYEDLHHKPQGGASIPAQYEVTIFPEPQKPEATPRYPTQNMKGVNSGACEDAGVSLENRQLPDVPQLHPSDDRDEDNSYEVPDRLKEYTGVYINIKKKRKLVQPGPIKVAEFQKFMSRNKEDVVSDIVQQFMALPSGGQYPWSVALKFQNKPRNFSKTILAYDHSRVKLATNGSDGRSDYINASYIKNQQGKTSFIAAQGPQECTVDDFWKMVWQKNVKTIVMVTDNIEKNKNLCCIYWPKKVHMGEVYGDINVILMESTSYTSHTTRKLNLLKGDHKAEVHTVTQVQVHSWPYGGVPKEPASLISIIKKVKSLQTDGSPSPLLVHCSNGVGATGTFIAVYVLMDTIQKNKDVNVFDFVKNMRDDRVDMVQTRIQYFFIFECLLAVLQSTDSQISCDQLKKLGHAAIRLQSKKEYKVLQESVTEEQHCEDYIGNSPENQHKNRFKNLIPVDKFRPVLKSQGNTFGSNSYINALHLTDFSGREFIMTQTPLTASVEDFWRLVYDYECTSIVMLNTVDVTDETVVEYWPSGGGAQYGLMKVVCTSTTKRDSCIQSHFQLVHKKVGEKSVSVDHFAFCRWSGNQPDVSKLRQFIRITGNKSTGPVLVHCINGVGLSAVYVVVKTESERLEQEGSADVFQCLTKLRKICPHAVQTQEEYTLCYQLLKDHLDNPEEYAVVY